MTGNNKQPTQKPGYLDDDKGFPSSMRLMSMIALFASIGITYFWTRRWPSPKFLDVNGSRIISVNYGLVLFLLLYLFAAVAIFVWKYSEFSAGFG